MYNLYNVHTVYRADKFKNLGENILKSDSTPRPFPPLFNVQIRGYKKLSLNQSNLGKSGRKDLQEASKKNLFQPYASNMLNFNLV